MGDKINAAPSWKYELAVKDYPKLQQPLAPYEKGPAGVLLYNIYVCFL